MKRAPQTFDVTAANGGILRILVVMATEAEYGPAMKTLGIMPLIIGVGPVGAAIALTAALKDMEWDGLLPDLIVNPGSAGSRQLDYKTVAQATSIGYRDMDASLFGFAKGHTPFSPWPGKLPIAVRIPGLPETAVSTGAAVVSGDAYDAIEEDAAEMEAYALYLSALHFGVPLVKIIGVSDGKKDLTGALEDWTQYLGDIDHGFAAAFTALKQALETGALRAGDLRLPETLQAIHGEHFKKSF